MSGIKKIILNEMSYFGAVSRAKLADEIIKRGFKKAFVVTDICQEVYECLVEGRSFASLCH